MNHDLLSLTDRISLIGELEHIRRHALRSAKVAKDKDKLFYEVTALQAQKLRREYQAKYLDCDEKDWCLAKSAATLKQLTYELALDANDLQDMENLTDNILSHAYNVDLTGCESCSNDQEQASNEIDIKINEGLDKLWPNQKTY